MTLEWFITEKTLLYVLIGFFKNQPMIDLMMENQTMLEISSLAKLPRVAN
jgi:hypothetical protein